VASPPLPGRRRPKGARARPGSLAEQTELAARVAQLTARARDAERDLEAAEAAARGWATAPGAFAVQPKEARGAPEQ
jgi:hypothetical protein